MATAAQPATYTPIDYAVPFPNDPNKKFHEYITINLQEKYDFHSCRSTLYFLLATASVVALVALAVFTMATCLEAPAFIPLVMVAISALTTFYYQSITKSLIENYRMHNEEKERILNIQNEIPNLSDDLFHNMDLNIDDVGAPIDDINLLYPLIARYRVYEKELEEQKQLSQALAQELTQIQDPALKLSKKRDYLISKEDNENYHRLKLAYIHHIVRFPCDQRDLSAFISSDTDALWRALSQRAGDADHDVIYRLKLKGDAPVTKTEIERLSISNLSHLIFQ